MKKKMAIAMIIAVSMVLGQPCYNEGVVVNAAERTSVKSPDKFLKISNDTFFKDKDGNNLYSQGGGIFEFNGTYYWYGVKYAEAVSYAETRTPSSVNNFVGITCYSSKDLVNWTDEGLIATPEDVFDADVMEGQPAAWVGRLGVTKLDDGTYALLVQHECDDVDNSIDNANRGDTKPETDGWSKQVLIMTSDSPTGHFKWNNRINMKSYIGTTNTGDQTVFIDPATGKGYLLYSYGSGRGRMYLSQIVKGDDGLVTLTESRMIYSGAGREGNCMFEYNGKYYVCASDLYGWNASHCYYLVLDSLDDEYLQTRPVTKDMYLMNGCSDDYCHVSQTGFFYKVNGTKQDTVIFCGDRWSDFADNGDGYNVWCPLSFDENGIPYFNSLSDWKLNPKTGEWKTDSNNNFVKNGSFDADRISVTDFVGWNEEILNGSGSITNTKDCVTGKYALLMSGTGEYKEKISQNISSAGFALDNGLYDFSAKIKNTDGFNELALYAISGGTEYGLDITEVNEEFSVVTLKNVVVENNQVELGIYADGNGGKAIVDDLTFIKSDEESYTTGTLKGNISGEDETIGKKVVVKAKSEDGKYYSKEVAITSGETQYEIAHLPEGTYGITVEGDGVAIKMDEESSKDNAIADIHAVNTTGSVKGRVITKTGLPLSGVEVTLKGNDEEHTQTTNESGEYEFKDIKQGSYSIEYSLKEYAVANDVESETKVAAGFTTVKADTQMGKVQGKVAGSVENGSNALIIAKATDGSTDYYIARADEDGEFQFDSLPGGEYTIMATTTPNMQYDSVPACAGKVKVSGSESIYISLRMGDDVTSKITNPTFDGKNLDGWENGGDKAGYRNGKKNSHGTYDLAPWANADFTVDTYQTISDLEDGYYVLSCYAQADYTSNDSLYLYGRSSDDTSKVVIPAGASSYELIALKVKVTDGQLTIGIAGNMSAGKWANIDDFHLGYLGNDIEIHKETVEEESEEMSEDYEPTTPASPETLEEFVLVGTSRAVVKKTQSEDNNKSDGGTSNGQKAQEPKQDEPKSEESKSQEGKVEQKPEQSNASESKSSGTQQSQPSTSASQSAPTVKEVVQPTETKQVANNSSAQTNSNVNNKQQVKTTTSDNNKISEVKDEDELTADQEEIIDDTTEEKSETVIENEQVPAAAESVNESESNGSALPIVLGIIAAIAIASGAGVIIVRRRL